MKNLSIKLLSLLLACMMVISCFAACANTGDEGETTGNTSSVESGDAGTTADKDGETSVDDTVNTDAATSAPGEGVETTPNKDNEEEKTESLTEAIADELDSLGTIDFGAKTFAVCYEPQFKAEVWGVNEIVDKEGGDDQLINDAVYKRNSLLETDCNLKFDHIAAANIHDDVTNEATAQTGDFQMIDTMAANAASFANAGYLYDFVDGLNVDLERPWWDSGTADFALNGKVFFMSGDANFADDNTTYVLIFNKDLRERYAATVPDPYQTVKDWEWTLEYFNEVIQGLSGDANGDGAMNELDQYGFITTWEYGNTFFIGSDLRYIVNDPETDTPTLFLADKSQMEKATKVLETAQKIYHDNDASFMSPPGQEPLGLAAFKDNRGLFYGEITSYLVELRRSSDIKFGVLPVPKYDKAQQFYRTWTHESGSALCVTSAVKSSEAELVGKVVQKYAILSSQHVKPAYYDVTLARKTIHDPESSDMLDIIFSNRVYDMAFFYKNAFGNYYDIFKTAVNNNKNTFTSQYNSLARNFNKRVNTFLSNLDKLDK